MGAGTMERTGAVARARRRLFDARLAPMAYGRCYIAATSYKPKKSCGEHMQSAERRAQSCEVVQSESSSGLLDYWL
jgi:hypothetical protein